MPKKRKGGPATAANPKHSFNNTAASNPSVATGQEGNFSLKRRIRFFDAMMRSGSFTPSEIKVAWALLYRFMNERSGRCDPSVPTLARESGLKDRAVQNALCRLVASGWWRIDVNGGTRTKSGYTNAYAPCFSAVKGVHTRAPDEVHGGAPKPCKGEPCSVNSLRSSFTASSEASTTLVTNSKEVFDFAVELFEDDRTERQIRTAIGHMIRDAGSESVLRELDDMAQSRDETGEPPTVDALYQGLYAEMAFGKPIRPDWKPSAADRAFAQALNLRIDDEAQRFVEYNLRHRQRFRIWSPIWRNWCRLSVNPVLEQALRRLLKEC
jgi:hypothetical protein